VHFDGSTGLGRHKSTRETPCRKWYELSVEGIKDAATALGEIAAPVVTILGQLMPFLLK
jgi:hypothetical protein